MKKIQKFASSFRKFSKSNNYQKLSIEQATNKIKSMNKMLKFKIKEINLMMLKINIINYKLKLNYFAQN